MAQLIRKYTAVLLLVAACLWIFLIPKRASLHPDLVGSWAVGLGLFATGMILMNLHRMQKLAATLGLGLVYSLCVIAFLVASDRAMTRTLNEVAMAMTRHTTIHLSRQAEASFGALPDAPTEDQAREYRSDLPFERIRWNQEAGSLSFWRDGRVTREGSSQDGHLALRDYGLLCHTAYPLGHLTIHASPKAESELYLEAWPVGETDPKPIGAASMNSLLQETHLALLQGIADRVNWE